MHRSHRGWDYIEDVGLIMAGSAYPDSQTVEITRDEGKTFEHLAEIPWGRPTEPEIIGPCVVILGSFHRWTPNGCRSVRSRSCR